MRSGPYRFYSTRPIDSEWGVNSARGKTGDDDLTTEVAIAVRDDGEPVRPASSEPVYDCGSTDEAAYLMKRRRVDSIRARAFPSLGARSTAGIVD